MRENIPIMHILAERLLEVEGGERIELHADETDT